MDRIGCIDVLWGVVVAADAATRARQPLLTKIFGTRRFEHKLHTSKV